MGTLLKISWRNVWRNKARSVVIILAVGFGLWGGISTTAFLNGMVTQMIDNGIKKQVSHLQIHNPEFLKERQSEFVLGSVAEIMDELDNSDLVQAYSPRTLTNGMLATASMTSGVEIYGIYADMENSTTSLGGSVIEGDYFTSMAKNQILIGAKLAKKMKVAPGNRVVLTFQDLDGNITSAAFRISGIYRTSNSMNDERFVYVKNEDITILKGDNAGINEIAVLLHDIENVNSFRDELKAGFPENEVRSWAEISPDLSMMHEMSGISMMILLIIILMAMAFGLLNTMLMTIFERTREIGVLMAVGMNKLRVFMMILLETGFLVFTGSLFGVFLGNLTIAVTRRTGIDLTSVGGDTFSDFGIDPVVYPSLNAEFYLNLLILVVITAVLSSIYPAYKALRMNPADAIRKD